MSFGRKTMPDGQVSYDYKKLEPALAESWVIAPDNKSVTFKLRKGAKFHDGTPVTAADVKWSFDRAVAVGGFPTFQMSAGSLEKPEQFVVVDERTFKVIFLRPDKMTMMNMAVPVPSIFNAELVKKNATAADPWGLAWTKNNTAGGGAYKVEAWRPGQEIVYVRNDDWINGPLPKIRRVIQRDVPNAGTRRALLLKGDIDMTYDMPPKDFGEMAKDQEIKVVSTPVENAMWYIGMNVKKAPFDNVKVRQAVALAIPYDKMFDVAVYGRANKLYGGANDPKTIAWPQAHGWSTDLPRARALLKEAGYENGFETVLSFDIGSATTNEPMAVLLQESLAQIGIKAQIGTAQEGHAADRQSLRRLAELSGVLLLLVLSRPERGVQHHVLPEHQARQDDRQRPLPGKQGDLRQRGESDDQAGQRGSASCAALSAVYGRGNAQGRQGLYILVPRPARLSRPVQDLIGARPWTGNSLNTGSMPPRRCSACRWMKAIAAR
jgi:ABC-type transport system substrate-binding protein